MGIVVLLFFWLAVGKLWISDGPRTPLKFIAAWVVGLVGLTAIGVSPILFQVYQAVLAITLWFILKSRT
jgi:hypothetical protein